MMFGQHVSKSLSAYYHDELPAEESRVVAEHLIGCLRCRSEFEEIKLGISLAEQLPRVPAPTELRREIDASLNEHPRHAVSNQQSSVVNATLRWHKLAPIFAVLLVLTVIGVIWFYVRQPHQRPGDGRADHATNPDSRQTPGQIGNKGQAEVNESPLPSQPNTNANPLETKNPTPADGATWEVARLEGAPKVGPHLIEESGRLGVGEWVETDGSSRAKINVANIGQVDIGPNSRVQLVATRSTEHRLALARGRLQAVISAPPRLFFVDTPSSVAVDLGCAYTLDVDDAGRSRLQVTSGWVALEQKGRESIVPAGASCVTQKGKGLGTPYFDDASTKFRNALAHFDFQNGGTNALDLILAEARIQDTLTLWHLLSRVRREQRGRVYDRIVGFSAPPRWVNREGVLRLDKKMLDLWKQELQWAWFG